MKKSTNTSAIASIEKFNETYIEFWRREVSAQIYNQDLGLLSEQIRFASGDERAELEKKRKEIEEKYTAEINQIFPLLRKLATRDGEIAIECYETLKSAGRAIVVNYTRLIAANPDLRDFYLGQMKTME